MRYLWAIAAGLILAFGLLSIEHKTRDLGVRNLTDRINNSKRDMTEAADQLKVYRASHRRYPTNDEGITAISPLLKERKAYAKTHERNRLRDMRVAPSGLLSPWGEPYIYENRTEKPAGAFAQSGVEDDRMRNYSVMVDDGIYLWSVATRDAYQKVALYRFPIFCAYVFVWGSAIICLGCFVVACRRRYPPQTTKRESTTYDLIGILIGTALAFLAYNVWLVFGPYDMPSCYIPRFHDIRSPELTKEHSAIMRKYRDNGAISKKAFDKLLKAPDADEKTDAYYQH